MKSLLHLLCACILSGSLASLLPACKGGGGNDSVRLFFGYGQSGSDGDCGFVEIWVDAEGADAVFAENGDGDFDCATSAFANQRGCDVAFDELEDGRLHVTAGGCDLSSFDALFQCGFREADLSVLANHVTVACDCEDDGCDHHPPACIGDAESLGDCERCDDHADNDGDDDTDCADANCLSSNKCDGSVSSTSSTSSTSTSGTDQSRECDITFRLLGEATVGSLQWTTDYSDAEAGHIVGSGESVQCESLVDGAIGAFNDNDAAETLASALVAVEGFTAPRAVARCLYSTDRFVSAQDFDVLAVEAETPESEPIEPAPTIEVRVNCGEPTTTTEEPAAVVVRPDAVEGAE